MTPATEAIPRGNRMRFKMDSPTLCRHLGKAGEEKKNASAKKHTLMGTYSQFGILKRVNISELSDKVYPRRNRKLAKKLPRDCATR